MVLLVVVVDVLVGVLRRVGRGRLVAEGRGHGAGIGIALEGKVLLGG